MDDFDSAIVYAANALASGWSTARTLAGMLLRFVGLSDVARAEALSIAQLGTQHNTDFEDRREPSLPGLPEIADSPSAESGTVTIKVTVKFPRGRGKKARFRSRIFDIPENRYPEDLDEALQKWIDQSMEMSAALRATTGDPTVKIDYIFRGE